MKLATNPLSSQKRGEGWGEELVCSILNAVSIQIF